MSRVEFASFGTAEGGNLAYHHEAEIAQKKSYAS